MNPLFAQVTQSNSNSNSLLNGPW